jgi:hypothetical protein
LNSFERALVDHQSIKAGPKKSSHAATADERVLDGLEAQHQYEATLDKQPAQDFDWTDNADRQQCEREDKPTTEANKPAKQPQKETTRTGVPPTAIHQRPGGAKLGHASLIWPDRPLPSSCS